MKLPPMELAWADSESLVYHISSTWTSCSSSMKWTTLQLPLLVFRGTLCFLVNPRKKCANVITAAITANEKWNLNVFGKSAWKILCKNPLNYCLTVRQQFKGTNCSVPINYGYKCPQSIRNWIKFWLDILIRQAHTLISLQNYLMRI